MTINDLAHTIRDQHGIDTLAAARDVVGVHVDQVADDPDLYDAETGELTADGAEVVIEAVTQSYRIGAVATQAATLLDEIADETAEIARLEEAIAEHTARRDEKIRAAMRTELRRADIAAAAGLKEARLYQIRDGRR